MLKTSDIPKKSLALHKKLRGKISVVTKASIKTPEDLSLIYSPGVGAASLAIVKDQSQVDALTWRRNTVAVISDGSAVLGLGNIGPSAALPVMEGKAAIFKRFTNIDAIPIVLSTQNTEEIITTIKSIAPSFGAIQLEDISAPRCFEIEERLSEMLNIPIMHDDQHGTAIIALAGLLNATKLTKRKDLGSVRIVLNGAGAAGTAIARLLLVAGFTDIIVCDRAGIIWRGRPDLNEEKKKLSAITNRSKIKGSLSDALIGADVFIGISSAGALTSDMVHTMAKNPIIFALANPVPEILPDVARKAGAAVVATGRSDFPNQLNNALCYPGLFRGMLDKRVSRVTDEIKLRAAKALAGFIKNPTSDRIVPNMFEKGLHEAMAKSVK
ncbi:NADP-dependent malic enzyme [Candidatus Uhrbacteria bacterium]|nr:NADP-dependent malic enzyme [Candidatus Uhrbacteria bacterium]